MSMKYGLVLAGGGVRGACHAGVWKALGDMGVEISSVAGASIGSINGAIFAQGDFDKAIDMWRGITAADIVNMPDGVSNGDDLFDVKNLSEIVRAIYDGEGLDMSPLERLLKGIIDEDKLRKSPIDFGVAAFSLTRKKEIYKFKNEIPRGEIVDYLMASACMPGFRSKVIEADKFADGGVSDNMPVGMLLGRGEENIITVDVKGAGIYRDFNTSGKNIISVCCDKPQTGLMDFDREGIERSIKEGYIKCMKAFGRYEGGFYAFKSDDYRRARAKYSPDLISGIETAARIYGIDELNTYDFDELVRLTLDAHAGHEKEDDTEDEGIADKILQTSEKHILTWLVKTLRSGAADFLKDKLSMLGSAYDAACALMYFKK